MKPSKRQQKIFYTWNHTDSNILINAVAGSGKTTTLLQLLEYCQYKTLFLAFNKSIQEEIQQKIDNRNLKQGKALTMHSLGLSAIRSSYKKVHINNGKNFEIIKKLQDNNKSIFRKMSWENKLKFSYNIMDMNNISRLFLTNDIKEISKHFNTMDKILYVIPELPILWDEFIKIRETYYQDNNIVVDFTDMIYLPVYKNLRIPIDPTYLMVDEAQDLNLCQHRLIENLINQGTVKKWIAVGDRNQAIYGFSGAFSSSFDVFKNKGNVVELPLDICYRCSTKIIDKANEVYDVMEYSNSNPGIVQLCESPEDIKDNSMVICRNSKPLIDLYFELLGYGKECYIKGEDILNSMIRFLKPYNKYTVSSARTEMIYKMEELGEDKSERVKIDMYYFKENFENFKKISEHLSEPNDRVEYLSGKLKTLFVNKKNATMLCTIHKSKGLEADVVYILNENLIPSKFAKSKEQLVQEQNLKYVARTRAKNELYFLNI